MPKSIIAGNPGFKKPVPQGVPYINVAEFFCDTIQGEGINLGAPAAFLRVQHCTQTCIWCCVADTQILMSDFSYKSIQEIKIGDRIKTYTKQGLVDTEVLNVLKREQIPTVKLQTEDGNSLHCSIDHRMVSYLNHKDSKNIKRRLIQAKDSLNSDIKTLPNYSINDDASKEYKLGYIKGVLLGDGCTKDINRIKLECCDVEMIQTLLDYMEELFDYRKEFVIKQSTQKNRKPYYRCVLTKKTINTELIKTPAVNEMKGFVAGFFDAEGTFGNEISMCQKDESVLNTIDHYLKSLSFSCNIDKNKTVSNLRILGGFKEWVRFMTFFNPKIKRKFDKIYQLGKIDGVSRVKEVTQMEVSDVFTLTTSQGYYISNNILSKNCDSQEVWRFGNPYTFSELFELMEEYDLPRKFSMGQHLVLTGGSPLLQQDQLAGLIRAFEKRYGFKPYVEIENEMVLRPSDEMVELVDCWNNSPKLKGSGNAEWLRYQPEIINYTASLRNSWCKFVVSNESDWQQIETDFINKGIVLREQVILMPMGATREELYGNRDQVLEIAIRENVRYTTREHIVVWGKMTGV